MHLSWIAVALLSVATPARAAGRIAAALSDGEHRYAELDFRGAATVCEEAARDGKATAAEQTRGWVCVGSAWLVLDQKSLARQAFDRAFALDPRYAIEDAGLSPRQRAFIEEVRKAHAADARDEEPAATSEPAVAVVVPVAPPPAAPHKPVYKRWYLWTPIVLGAVGAGLGFALGFGYHPPPPRGTLPQGTVDLSNHLMYYNNR
jgi:hypothetical protein